MKHSLLFSLLCLLLSALPAQDFSERFKVLANDRGTADRFGSSVALKGNRLLVGAPTERHNLVGANALQEAGSAYFFEKNAQGQWIQVQKIIASDRSAGANLGHQVVLGEQVALIAAHKDSTGLSGDSTYQEAGAVYVFRQDSSGVWQETQKLVASDRAPFDWFGHRVVMQGNRALISAWGRDNAGPGGQVDNRTGAVYAFEADSMGFWQQTQILALTDTGTSEEVGFSLAMDGDLALIGAPGETEDENGQNTEIRAGAAYVWEYLPNGQWQLVQKLVAPIRQFDIEGFGTNVAMKDSMLVIYQSFNIDFSEVLFSFLPDSSGTWKLKETITFGGQIIPGRAICMQDSFLLIGNPINQSRRGRGYLLRMTPTGSWEAVSDFVASDRRQNHEFAYSVAMDDSVLVFGARLEAPANPVYGAMGAVYVFETCTPDFPEQQASICTGDSLWFEGAYVSEAG
ncbi:MAG: FG-GAP repeat protein, partial [Bacteroidota bacterium]